MTAALGWINGGLAFLAMLAAFGSVNKMQWGKTKPCVIGAMVLIAVGLAGHFLGLVKEDWARYADTALYGGVLALLISSQRVHSWFLERFSYPIASIIVWSCLGVFLLGLLGGCAAQPEAPTVEDPWERICYVQPLGRTENGLHVAAYHCTRQAPTPK